MTEQKLTYQQFESLRKELESERILEVPCIKEELDAVQEGIKSLNPNIEKIFGGKYRYFVLLFDVMLSADGLNDLYRRAVAGKMPQLKGLDPVAKSKIIFYYNQQPFRIFNITGDSISLRHGIPNFQLPYILRTVFQRVRLKNSIYSSLTRELEPYVEDFENNLKKTRREINDKEYYRGREALGKKRRVVSVYS